MKKSGFSLAEALITLLIVCLITLASIPVITKKKRDQNSQASGTWMCSLNSNGQYVVYNSVSPKGDPKDPDSWALSQNGEGCTFYPPLNTKNFVITAIGGGGAGRDGMSERSENYLSDQIDSYTPEKTGIYNLAVIGGGGGGAGSDDGKTGGSGGAGGYWIGQVELKANTTYYAYAGKGVKGINDGGSKAGWGPYAEASTFRNTQTTYITANGGRGGRCTGDDMWSSPWGGNGGSGGTIVTDPALYTSLKAKPLRSGQGNNGKYRDTNQTEGTGIANHFWGLSSPGIYGEYGKGGYGKNGAGIGGKGGNGAVFLWQIMQYAGNGGYAAKPESYNLPTIPSKAVITIGSGGTNNSKGKTTLVDIYDIQGNVIRTMQGYGGDPGEQAENNNYDPDSVAFGATNATLDTSGQPSLYNNNPGGVTGKCIGSEINKDDNNDENNYITEFVIDETTGQPICKYWYYDIGKYQRVLFDPTNPNSGTICPLSQNENSDGEKGFCIGYIAPYEDKYKNIITDINEEKYAKSNKDLDGLKTELFASGSTAEENAQSWSTAEYFTSDSEPQCLVYKTEQIPDNSGSSTTTEAKGPDATPGSSFGAGGGGGCTTNQVGVFGKGGAGAPGAVIIQW